MTEASQVRRQLRNHIGPLLRLVPFSAPAAVPWNGAPDHYWRGRGLSGWIESKLIPSPSGRCPNTFTLAQLIWGEEEVAVGGKWHLLGLVQSKPARWVLYDAPRARAWFEGNANEPLFSIDGRFPTRELLRELIRMGSSTDWTELQASNATGNVTDMEADGLDPEEAASEILRAATEDG